MKICFACAYQNPNSADSCQHCTAPLQTFCADCGSSATPGSRFCAKCGTPLLRTPALVCSLCQTALPPGSKFCGQCGQQVDAQPLSDPSLTPDDPTSLTGQDRPGLENAQQYVYPEQEQSLLSFVNEQHTDQVTYALQSERRDVTVVFMDVMSAAHAPRTLDGEDIYWIVDEAMQLAMQAIYKYEGTVDKFTSGGLMALFGAPVAHENDTERAVRAALEIQEVLQPLQRRLLDTYGFDLSVTIGISRGGVIAGQVGSNLYTEYTVIGDMVNLAARLQNAAEPGQILVSADVKQQTHPIFYFRAVRPLRVKGYDDEVPAYQPIGIRQFPGQIRGIPGLSMPLVGRTSELQQLHALWFEVQQTGQSRLALVSGEAGLGKSRLVAEFSGSIDPLLGKVFEGGCLAYARSHPFWMIANLLRSMLNIQESDSYAEQQEKLSDCIQGFDLANQRIVPYLLNLLGLEQPTSAIQEQMSSLDAVMLRRQTHTSVRLLLQAAAREAPFVIILEDIHWIDPASAELLIYLCHSLLDSPIFLLCNTRDYERQTSVEPILRALNTHPERFSDIQLPRLSGPETHQLLTDLFAVVTDDSLALRQTIVERSEGIPFYVGEIVRMLMDQGLLVAQGNRLVTTHASVQAIMTLPGTLKSLILARFDTLDEDQRLVLRHAAVIGRSFPVRLLLLLSNMHALALNRALDALKNRLILSEEPVHDERNYVFCHALIQEAVYSTILHRDRKLMHGLVADAIDTGEFFAEEERSEILGYHLGECESPLRAVPHLAKAAENARARSAHETALDFYQRGVALLESVPPHERVADQHDQFFRISIGLGQTLKLMADFAGAGERLAHTTQLLATQVLANQVEVHPSKRVYWIEALRELADVRQREGNLGVALLHIEEAIQQWQNLQRPEPDALWYGLQDRLAWIRFRQGNLDEAASLATDAIHFLEAQAVAPAALLASLYNTVGGVFYQKRATADAVLVVERSLRLHDSLGYAWGKAIAATNLGLLHYVTGDWVKAIEWYTWSIKVCQENGFVAERAINLRNLGLLYISQGKSNEAVDAYQTALVIAEQIGDKLGIGCSCMGLALEALRSERFDDVDRYLSVAVAVADTLGEDNLVQLRLLQAQLAHRQQDVESAIIQATQALELAATADLAEEQMEAERILGVLLSAVDRSREAEDHLHQSIEYCRQRNDPYRLGQALFELARHFQRCIGGQPGTEATFAASAIEAGEGSAALFRRVGAQHDLALAEQLLGDCRSIASLPLHRPHAEIFRQHVA